jgi:hypothetical protein
LFVFLVSPILLVLINLTMSYEAPHIVFCSHMLLSPS